MQKFLTRYLRKYAFLTRNLENKFKSRHLSPLQWILNQCVLKCPRLANVRTLSSNMPVVCQFTINKCVRRIWPAAPPQQAHQPISCEPSSQSSTAAAAPVCLAQNTAKYTSLPPNHFVHHSALATELVRARNAPFQHACLRNTLNRYFVTASVYLADHRGRCTFIASRIFVRVGHVGELLGILCVFSFSSIWFNLKLNSIFFCAYIIRFFVVLKTNIYSCSISCAQFPYSVAFALVLVFGLFGAHGFFF